MDERLIQEFSDRQEVEKTTKGPANKRRSGTAPNSTPTKKESESEDVPVLPTKRGRRSTRKDDSSVGEKMQKFKFNFLKLFCCRNSIFLSLK